MTHRMSWQFLPRRAVDRRNPRKACSLLEAVEPAEGTPFAACTRQNKENIHFVYGTIERCIVSRASIDLFNRGINLLVWLAVTEAPLRTGRLLPKQQTAQELCHTEESTPPPSWLRQERPSSSSIFKDRSKLDRVSSAKTYN